MRHRCALLSYIAADQLLACASLDAYNLGCLQFTKCAFHSLAPIRGRRLVMEFLPTLPSAKLAKLGSEPVGQYQVMTRRTDKLSRPGLDIFISAYTDIY